MLSSYGYQIASSTYWAAKKRPRSVRSIRDELHIGVIKELWVQNYSCYGIRKMWKLAHRHGYVLGRDQIARLMLTAHITGVTRGRKTVTTSRNDTPIASRFPDLIQRGWKTISTPDQVWVADFTYVPTYQGFVYTSFVTDVASRRILGWKTSMSKDTSLVTDALQMAISGRKRDNTHFCEKRIIHHSDAGSQYRSLALSSQLQEAKIMGSIGTVADALDNALMESAIGLYKTEIIHTRKSWPTLQAVETATAQWIHWYNTRRLHSSLNWNTPQEYEKMYNNQQQEKQTA